MKFSDMAHADSGYNQTKAPGAGWGVVTDNEDPRKLGRIKVRLSWHTERQESHWIPRRNGGGSNYGSTQNIPQIGEVVSIHYEEGSQHYPTYGESTWTGGGHDRIRRMPASLPPSVPFQPRHDPKNGKFKVWFWRSLSGWLLRMGEGLDWLQFKTPKGYDFRLEHDVPVGGMDKDAAVSSTPYHRLNLTTPTGHSFTVLEHKPEHINDISVSHVDGMTIEMTSRENQKTARLQVDGFTLEISSGETSSIRMQDSKGQFVDLSPEKGLHSQASLIYEDGQLVLLGHGAGKPVARVGDKIQIIGVQPGPATLIGTIISGSSIVKSA